MYIQGVGEAVFLVNLIAISYGSGEMVAASHMKTCVTQWNWIIDVISSDEFRPA